MPRLLKDEGIILKKTDLLKDDKLFVFFAKNAGKLKILGKGVKKITSRRLPHLDTGNYLRFFYYQKDSFLYLQETELLDNYQLIKSDNKKLKIFLTVLFVLDKILPENQPEPEIYKLTIDFFNVITHSFGINLLESYLKEILLKGGFINESVKNNKKFSPLKFFENLINQPIKFLDDY